jgi:hypothetical protein
MYVNLNHIELIIIDFYQLSNMSQRFVNHKYKIGAISKLQEILH